jgi:pantoate--beta-alanine ligase
MKKAGRGKAFGMRIISSIGEMQRMAEELRLSGKRIGVVPTMGFLHDGHRSLIQAARGKSDIVIVTIFVNPTQFSPSEDFEQYPRDLERDRRLAEKAGCDILFAPQAGEMYPERHLTYVEVEALSKILEGEFRPTHFRGVTTVVAKLFNITKPHLAVFGQKDAQQAVIIRQMVGDLNFDVKILVMPIVRESDGLAMSSRNVYLSPKGRAEALVLRRALVLAEELIRGGERDTGSIKRRVDQLISEKRSAAADYVAIVDANTLEELRTLESGRRTLIAVAVRVESTRLIDNTVIIP